MNEYSFLIFKKKDGMIKLTIRIIFYLSFYFYYSNIFNVQNFKLD